MRYHFVLNGYLQNCQKLMQEMKAFKEMYLSDAEEGITYLYCQSEEIAKQLNGQLTKNVSVLAAEEYVPETVLKGLEELAKPKEIYIFGSDYAGEELAVRLGARMGGSSLTAVSSVGIENGTEDKIKAGKMVYSNHMEAVFQMKKGPYCISLAKGFAKMELHPGQMQITEVHNFNDKDATSYIIKRSFVPEDQEEGLEEAKVLYAPYHAAEIGQKADMKFVFDDNSALLTYAPKEVDLEEPSAGYIYTWDMLGNGQWMATSQYDGPGGSHSEFIEGLMATDMKKTSDDLATFLSGCVSE